MKTQEKYCFKPLMHGVFFLVAILLVTFLEFAHLSRISPMLMKTDKLLHFLVFGLVTVFILQGSGYSNAIPPHNKLRRNLAFVAATILGVLTELMHLLAVNRNFDLIDMLANLSGIYGVGFIYIWLNKAYERKEDSLRFDRCVISKPFHKTALKIRSGKRRWRGGGSLSKSARLAAHSLSRTE